jgi:DNA-binding NarL/FixJ family response regulator
MLKVCIADDHRLILNAVGAALRDCDDIEVVGRAQSGDEALGLIEVHRPDVVLLDRHMPGLDGLSCLKTIKERWPQMHVVMLSATEDPKQIAEALEAGASAYIGKRIGPADLASALRHVAAGVVYQRSAGADEEKAGAGPAPGGDLTQRERTLLEAVARGLSTKAISRELWISEKTVKFHLTNIYRKLGVHNRTGAMRHAFEHGLVSSPSASQGDDAVSA